MNRKTALGLSTGLAICLAPSVRAEQPAGLKHMLENLCSEMTSSAQTSSIASMDSADKMTAVFGVLTEKEPDFQKHVLAKITRLPASQRKEAFKKEVFKMTGKTFVCPVFDELWDAK